MRSFLHLIILYITLELFIYYFFPFFYHYAFEVLAYALSGEVVCCLVCLIVGNDLADGVVCVLFHGSWHVVAPLIAVLIYAQVAAGDAPCLGNLSQCGFRCTV